jgi:hypothetical protein
VFRNRKGRTTCIASAWENDQMDWPFRYSVALLTTPTGIIGPTSYEGKGLSKVAAKSGSGTRFGRDV